jgi:hypothetical protein
LKRTEPQEVEEIGIETCDAIPDALVEKCIESRTPAEHSINELARPTPITGVEMVLIANASIE